MLHDDVFLLEAYYAARNARNIKAVAADTQERAPTCLSTSPSMLKKLCRIFAFLICLEITAAALLFMLHPGVQFLNLYSTQRRQSITPFSPRARREFNYSSDDADLFFDFGPLPLSAYPTFDPDLTCNPIPPPFDVDEERLKWGALQGWNGSDASKVFSCHTHWFDKFRDQNGHLFSTLDRETSMVTFSSKCDSGRIGGMLSKGVTRKRKYVGSISRYWSLDVSGYEVMLFHCFMKDGSIAYDLHFHLEIDADLAERLRSRQPPVEQKPPYNVLMLVIDSLSLAHFYRQFPRSVAQLNKTRVGAAEGISHRLYHFRRFSTMGAVTVNNLGPVITGYDIPTSWIPMHKALEEQGIDRIDRLFNEALFPNVNVFEAFHRSGFINSHHEQAAFYFPWTMPDILLISHPEEAANGASQDEARRLYSRLVDTNFFEIMGDVLHSQNIHNLYGDDLDRLCIAGKSFEQHEFEHLDLVYRTFAAADLDIFSYSVFNTVHEGSGRRGASMDKYLAEFLQRHLQRFPDTVLLIMSDHGLGYGGAFPNSALGSFEYKSPVLFLAVPNSLYSQLSDRHKHNLRVNQERLVFSTDVYRTLRWLANPFSNDRGLVGEEFSKTRNCSSVKGVVMALCSCQQPRPLNKSPSLNILLDHAVSRVNELAGLKTSSSSISSCVPVHSKGIEVEDLSDHEGSTMIRASVKVDATLPDGEEVVESFSFYYQDKADAHTYILEEGFAAGLQKVSVRVGESWTDEKTTFKGMLHTLQTRSGLTAVVHVPRPLKPADMFSRCGLVSPVDNGFVPIGSSSMHTIDDKGLLVIDLPDLQEQASGIWYIHLFAERKKGAEQLVVKGSFGIFRNGDDDDDGRSFNAGLVDHFWYVDNIVRDSSYGRYQACAPSVETEQFCMCKQKK